MTDIDVTSFEQKMWDAGAAIDDIDAEIARLQEQRKAAQAEANLAVERYGAALSITDQPVSLDVLRRLYWQHRAVRVETMAKAFGLGNTGQVFTHVGQSSATIPCPGRCGNTVTVRNRTQKVGLCPACQQRQREELEEAWKLARQRKAQSDVESDRKIREKLESGLSPEEVFIALTNGDLTWWRPIEDIRALAAERF